MHTKPIFLSQNFLVLQSVTESPNWNLNYFYKNLEFYDIQSVDNHYTNIT
jgi:hypothetical protein